MNFADFAEAFRNAYCDLCGEREEAPLLYISTRVVKSGQALFRQEIELRHQQLKLVVRG